MSKPQASGLAFRDVVPNLTGCTRLSSLVRRKGFSTTFRSVLNTTNPVTEPPCPAKGQRYDILVKVDEHLRDDNGRRRAGWGKGQTMRASTLTR